MIINTDKQSVNVRGVTGSTHSVRPISAIQPTTAESIISNNAIVYAALRYFADAVGSITVSVRKRDNSVAPEDHQINKIVERPNEYSQTLFNVIRSIAMFYNVYGEAYIIAIRDKSTLRAKGIIVPPPFEILHLMDKNKNIVGYEWQRSDGTVLRFPLMDVAMMTTIINPTSRSGYAIPPLLPIYRTVVTDNTVTALEDEFFRSGTLSQIGISYSYPLDKDTIEEIQARWNELFSGDRHWFDPVIFDGGAEIVKLGMQIGDLEPLRAIDSRNESRITMVLGVPLSLLSGRPETTSSTYSNKETDRRIFWADTVYPFLKQLESALHSLLDMGDGVRIRFIMETQPALAEMFSNNFDMMRTLVAFGGAKLGEMRDAVGLPRDGVVDDLRFVPLNGVLITPEGKQFYDIENHGYSAEPPQDVSIDVGTRALNYSKRYSGGYDPVAYSEVKLTQAARYEVDVFSMSESPIAEERRRVIALVEKYYNTEDTEEEREKLYDELYIAMVLLASKRWSVLLDPLKHAATSGLSLHNMQFSSSVSPTDFFASDAWAEYTMHFADPLSKTAHDEIKALIETAYRRGYTKEQLIESLETLFRQWINGDVYEPQDVYFARVRLPLFRRSVIARTETVRVMNMAEIWAAVQNGFTHKEWIAKRDNRTRQTHRIGRTWREPYIVRIDEPFIVGGAALMYPGDPLGPPDEVVNCRCVAVPVKR